MYLKRIELQGFKSFANKTEIEFERDITAIVGPNGSGKSNISDAIRWVLGEQSIKNLRGNKMEDVIFSGTDERRALGFAEVSMYFDNEKKYIPLDYNEVVVTRRMFRSGESEFYINKNQCRLKDIRELFMDTGIGKDGYSIIGQGRIDEILSDRPEDRRSIFEEAAGIIKYKDKKNSSEKKLSDTEENLIRIYDLIHEVSKQEKALAIEARKAKEFTSLYDKLKILEVNLYIRDINKLKKDINEIETEINKDLREIEGIKSSQGELKYKFQELEKRLKETKNKIEETKSNHLETIQDIDNNKYQINLLKEKERFQKKDKERIDKEIKEVNYLIKILEEKEEKLSNENKSITENYKFLYKDFQTKEDKLIDINKNIRKAEEMLDDERTKIIRIYNKISQRKEQLKNIKELKENTHGKTSRLYIDIEEFKKSKCKIREDIDKLSVKEVSLKDNLILLDSDKEKYKLEEDNFKVLLSNALESIRSSEIKLQGIKSNYKLYQNMEEYYEGYYNSVKNLLNAINKSNVKSDGYIGVVIDLFNVEDKYAKAIDISLGSRLQNIVIEKEEDAKPMIEYLKGNNKGRVTFLPINILKGNPINIDIKSLRKDGVLDLGHNLIEYDKNYKELFHYLLGRTIIIDNINNGIKLANKYKHNYKIVTLDGEVLNPGGSLTGGSYNNDFSLIKRRNKISQLKREIEKCNKDLDNLKRNKNLILNEFEYNKERRKAIEEKIRDNELNILKISNEKNGLLNEEKILIKTIYNNVDETKIIEKEILELKEKESRYTNELKILDIESKKNQEDINSLEVELSKYKEIKDNIDKGVTDYKVNLKDLQNKLESLNNNINSIKEEKDNSIYSLQNKKETLESINKESELSRENRKVLLKEIENQKEKEYIINKELDNLKSIKEEFVKEFEKIQESLRDIDNTLVVIEKDRNQRDLNLSKYNLQYENKCRLLQEDYELDYTSALELEDKSINVDKSKIIELKSLIKDLGNINLSSLEEYKAVKDRLDFLNNQYTDLINSKKDLEKIILDIEKEMTKQFNKSFIEINKNFTKIFSIFFGGGIAELELEKGEDILSSGIQINVQPPGKRLQNINLLSGGEKALTALALLFAILELKPAPFCILDEIDAALDEANISKYTNYLKKINKNTQFILITHKKTTMEIANILYGVTMVEKGISKLLSVKLEDYIEDLVS